MPLTPAFRLLLAAALVAVALQPPASAQPSAAPPTSAPVAAADPGPAAEPPEPGEGRLPAAVTTRHQIVVDGRTLAFRATAGAITLTSNANEPEADIAFVAYALDAADLAARPVTFAVNGGPGAASAYLDIGAIGPWRLPMDDKAIVPSQPTALIDNPETWLGFTDLVFIDPVGTGFSRLVEPDDARRDRYLSIDGDVASLSDFILRWLAANGRTASPKYFVGESYGGFRGPLIAEELQTEDGVALNGMTLLSPVLDFGWWRQPDYAPIPAISLLPSLAAAAMEDAGTFSPEALAAVEDYAAGDYAADLLRGLRDPAAVGRIVGRVSEITGLDRRAVERAAGRVDASTYAREVQRDDGRVVSAYDPSVTSADPSLGRPGGRAADPVLDAMTAPLTSAMLGLYRDRLNWLPERRYMLLNRPVGRAWDWGGDWDQPEAVGALRRVLALDPDFRLLVAHGYSDLVTPYFASELILRQLPPFGAGDRVRQANYPGGHMFYLRDASRRSFRDDARALYEPQSG